MTGSGIRPAVLPFDASDREVVISIFEAYADPHDIQLALLGRIQSGDLTINVVDDLFIAHGWKWLGK